MDISPTISAPVRYLMKPLIACLTVLVVSHGLVSVRDVRGAEIEYRAVLPSVEFPAGAGIGAVSGVGVDSKGQIYVLQREKPPVLCFDRKGKFLRSFGDEYIGKVGGHGLTVDPEDNV